jgi:hypothetical protein
VDQLELSWIVKENYDIENHHQHTSFSKIFAQLRTPYFTTLLYAHTLTFAKVGFPPQPTAVAAGADCTAVALELTSPPPSAGARSSFSSTAPAEEAPPSFFSLCGATATNGENNAEQRLVPKA